MTSAAKSLPTRRLRVVGALVLVVLLASGCAANNDPSNWEEAIDDGTLEENFMRSCRTANEGGDLNVSQAESYCDCAFEGLAQRYADDFDEFKDSEKKLRSDPEDINPAIRELFTRCLQQ